MVIFASYMSNTLRMQKFAIALILLFFTLASPAQKKQTLDKIVAKVGSQNIKASDIESQYYELRANDENISDTTRCGLMESALLQALFVAKAERDSIWVPEEQVEAELDNRLRYFVYQYGSEENIMRITGKSLQQMKDDFRPKIKNQMLAKQVQNEIFAAVKVNPREVTDFYNSIPQDSLPKYGAQVEVAQLILIPKASDEIEQYTYQKMVDLRKEIVEDGKSFDIMAGIYSQDPGSKNNGGELGIITKDQVVPAFANNVFKLADGEISQVFRSRYGYHIAQMMKRDGDKAKVRHILMKPTVTNADMDKYLDSLSYIRGQIDSGKISFQKAVGKYSQDDQSKMTGGFVLDANGNSFVELDLLDPQALKIVDTLEVGKVSAPHLFQDQNTGETEARIIYLKNKTKPHVANLEDDYDNIQRLALQQKQFEEQEIWVRDNVNDYYVEITNDYSDCENVNRIRSFIAQ